MHGVPNQIRHVFANRTMPSGFLNSVQNGPPSMQDIEWADLNTLDLSLFDSPNGKQQLANKLAKSLHTCGFFSVKNFGIARETIEQQFKLCETFFGLPLEEKLLYHDKEGFARGDTTGYKPQGAHVRR
jgi:isopenicillin N synthase-like dioxygenase